MNEILNPERVKATFMDCLFRDGEVIDGKPPEGTVVVEGIMGRYGLHPERVAQNKDAIVEMLNELPESFHEKGGGGMSFTQACVDRNGDLWTGVHRTMEELFVLGVAIKRVSLCLPRSAWAVLPGGMPYYVIHETDQETANAG